ncbi:hypothetical protein O1L60_37760 [Streptomyces diastatochromogenes]|nr:hypothetical protein [Streptomyces diastatochromogenes]
MTVVQVLFGAVVAGGSFWSAQAVLSARGAGCRSPVRGAADRRGLGPPRAGVRGGRDGARRAAAEGRGLGRQRVRPAPAAAGVLTERRHLSAVLAHATPLHAWQRLAGTGPPIGVVPWSAGGAWLVYALWALGGAVVTVPAVRRRDQ